MNAIWPEENFHYLDVLLKGEIDTSHRKEPINCEPDKCEGKTFVLGYRYCIHCLLPLIVTLIYLLKILRIT